MNELAGIASDYIAAGISVVPLRLDGSKAPAIKSWKEFQSRAATSNELYEWFKEPAGIGVVTGKVSGGLEVIDFDHNADETFFGWMDLLPLSIRTRLTVVETGGLGYHVIYRSDQVNGNIKIAKTTDGKQTIVETRGEGGYIVGVGSPLAVHASGSPYVQTHGMPLPEVTRITPEQRKQLWQAAAKFDQRPDPMAEYVERRKRELNPQQHRDPNIDTPWDDFDQRSQWSDILIPHGWTTHDGVCWTRPGKVFGTSAKVVNSESGVEVLTVFSANAGPLAPSDSHRTFGKFCAFTELNHNGNRSDAAKAVIQLGYGKQGRKAG